MTEKFELTTSHTEESRTQGSKEQINMVHPFFTLLLVLFAKLRKHRYVPFPQCKILVLAKTIPSKFRNFGEALLMVIVLPPLASSMEIQAKSADYARYMKSNMSTIGKLHKNRPRN